MTKIVSQKKVGQTRSDAWMGFCLIGGIVLVTAMLGVGITLAISAVQGPV